MSVEVSCEKPAAAVASTKITIAIWNSSLRLNRSASLPQTGVEIAVVSSVAVTTHVKAVWSPSRSWMMTGSEVETTVEASIDTNMPRRRPERDTSTRRCCAAGAAVSCAAEVRADIRVLQTVVSGERDDGGARWLTMVNS